MIQIRVIFTRLDFRVTRGQITDSVQRSGILSELDIRSERKKPSESYENPFWQKSLLFESPYLSQDQGFSKMSLSSWFFYCPRDSGSKKKGSKLSESASDPMYRYSRLLSSKNKTSTFPSTDRRKSLCRPNTHSKCVGDIVEVECMTHRHRQ